MFKSLVLLFKEAEGGDFLRQIVLKEERISEKRALKYVCDVLKGLVAFHNNNVVHCSVKPSSIYLTKNGDAQLGEMAKVELDAARHTN